MKTVYTSKVGAGLYRQKSKHERIEELESPEFSHSFCKGRDRLSGGQFVLNRRRVDGVWVLARDPSIQAGWGISQQANSDLKLWCIANGKDPLWSEDFREGLQAVAPKRDAASYKRGAAKAKARR